MNNFDDKNKTKEQLIRELELLRQQNEEMIIFKEIYNAMKDGVVVTDDQGKVLLQNKIAEDIFNSLQEVPSRQYLSSLLVPEKPVEAGLNGLKGFHEKKNGGNGDKSITFSHRMENGKKLEIHKVFLKRKYDNRGYSINIIREIAEYKLYEMLFDNTLDLCYICDAEGNILFVNKVFEELTGHKTDEFMGKPFATLFDEENLTKAMELYTGTLQGKTLQSEIAFKDTGVLCEYKNMPLKDDEGKVIGVLGIARDISFRRQMEEHVRTYARQKGIVAQIGTTALSEISIENLFVEVVSTVRTTFDVEYCNILEFFPDKKELVIAAGIGCGEKQVEGVKIGIEKNSQEGYTLLMGKPVVLKDRTAEKRFNNAPFVIKHGIMSSVTVIIQGKDTPFGILGIYTTQKRVFPENAIHFLQSIANVLADAVERHRIEKELILLNKLLDQRVKDRTKDLQYANLLLKKEVEDHKLTEKALKVSEAKYEDLYNNAPVMYITVEAKTFTILECNKAVKEKMGYSKKEIIGKDIFSLFHADVLEHQKNVIQCFFRNGKMENAELQLRHKDGKTTDIILNASAVFDEKGNIISGRFVWKDITEKKLMVKALLQSKKLQAMGVMAAGIAHGFNNILASISGNVQMLIRENKGREKLLGELGVIIKSCRDGAEIVRRMNEFTRTMDDIGKYVVMNINELVKNAIHFARPLWKDMAEGMGIQYTVTMEGLDETISNIKGNPSELREAMVNIIHNAIGAMPEGGQLSLSTWEEEGFVCLSISDTGIGMDEETQSKIFDPFFTRKGGQGMGLGMSLVYGITLRHGGRIMIKSEVGKGSTIILKFPSTTETIGIDTIAKGKKGHIKGGNRILVVDDELTIGRILQNFLSDHGYMVLFVNNGREAISILQKEKVDMIICDLGMPEVSGWDIMKFVDTLEIKPKIAIITGFLNLDAAFSEREIKAEFVIHKPFELNEILNHIQNVL